jgi:hypothetical protein
VGVCVICVTLGVACCDAVTVVYVSTGCDCTFAQEPSNDEANKKMNMIGNLIVFMAWIPWEGNNIAMVGLGSRALLLFRPD